MQQPTATNDRTTAVAATPTLRLFRPDKPVIALGLAVNYLMTKPAFAQLAFGDWSRVLVGQINRGHYSFAVDRQNRVQGFVGWALTTRELAEAWVEGRRALAYEESKAGDCIVFNAWAAESTAVHRFLFDEARKLINDKQTVYFKRHYPDGSTRPVRLSVNDFVAEHIKRKATAAVSPAPESATTSPPHPTPPVATRP